MSTGKKRSGKGAGRPKKGQGQYTDAQRQRAIQQLVAGKKSRKVAEELGCSTETIRLWKLKAQREGKIPTVSPSLLQEQGGASAEGAGVGKQEAPGAGSTGKATAPHDPGHGMSAAETEAILDYKREHPGMGPAQIRAQLKRFKGWRISVKAIAGVLKNNGYELEHRGSRPEGFEPQRFEAPHRNALWQVDFWEARLQVVKLFVLLILDDFSRFLVAVRVMKAPKSEGVVETFREAIRLHGKPEAVYTDRGGAFLAWRDESGFERFCEEQLIDHHVSRAYHPQGRGKVEALIRTIQQELFDVEHFPDVQAFEQALAAFRMRYNSYRAHMGIDGLTPADRYFGRWPEVLEQINAESRKRNGVYRHAGGPVPIEEAGVDGRPVEALRLVLHAGNLEVRLFGHRVVVGRVEP